MLASRLTRLALGFAVMALPLVGASAAQAAIAGAPPPATTNHPEKLDPAVKNTFEGPSAGTGAIFRWAGNNKVGEGNMTITESRPNELIRLDLEFLKPFKDNNTAEFTFKPDGSQTAVAWSMSGKKNFMFKAMGLFMDTDKMVGGDFEKGLAALKAVAESVGGK